MGKEWSYKELLPNLRDLKLLSVLQTKEGWLVEAGGSTRAVCPRCGVASRYRAMSKASNYSGHDRATNRRAGMPGKDEMRSDVEELREYDKLFRKRAEDLRRERTAKVEEPEKVSVVL